MSAIRSYKASFVRPSNTTAYTAGDAVSSATGGKLTFFEGEEFASGKVVAAKLSITNDNTTNGNFQLFLFNDDANIPTVTDNASFNMTADADEDLLGYTVFALETTGSGNPSSLAWDVNTGLAIPYVQRISSGAAQGLYGVLVATAAYSPLSPSTTVDVIVYVEPIPE